MERSQKGRFLWGEEEEKKKGLWEWKVAAINDVCLRINIIDGIGGGNGMEIPWF